MTANAHKDIWEFIQTGQPDTARALLQICQENAIYIGTMLEQAYGEGISTVKLLEEYCDLVYQIHEELEQTFDVENARKILDSLLGKIATDLRAKILEL